MEAMGGAAAAILPDGNCGAAPAWVGLDGTEAHALAEACQRHPVAPGQATVFDSSVSAGASGPGQAMTAVLAARTGEDLGRLCVLLRPGEGGTAPSTHRALVLLAGLIADAISRDRREAAAAAALKRARRQRRTLQLIAGAESIADALTDMLRELCTHHGALVGRIWRMSAPGDMLQEVSRFNGDDLDARSYYRQPPLAPMIWGNSFTADAIRRNLPRFMIYDEIEHPERYVLLQAAMQSGLKCQVSYPIWVQDERFGISLAFSTRRGDLSEVVADIAALADAIWPALLRKVTEDRIRFLAHHDDLTQLANRPCFQEHLAQAVAAAADGTRGLGLLYVDLDGFKQVNDTRGHAIGDKLLAAVAGRLSRTIRAEDTVARIGGDEFAIIQAHDDQPRSALQLAARLVDVVAAPFEIEGQLILAGCSVGIAAYPAQGDTPDLLLRNADTALYCAKATGRSGFRLFEPTMDTPLRERMLIEGEMAGALARSEFTLAFQPVCDAGTLGTIGFEALLRWTHPERGPVAPEVFIPIAEASGLILPLGQWALEAACAEAARWEPPVRLAVNLSPLQFRQPDLPGRVAAALARSGLAPGRLDLEVTEGLLLDDAGLVLDTMDALRAQGVGMTLDDFGTAYASLSYLRRFPFDRIKIDKSFIAHITGDKETLAIVQTILALSERLNLSVVAEGVETPGQLDALRGLGCRVVQGYLTGRPMPGADVPAHLARHPA